MVSSWLFAVALSGLPVLEVPDPAAVLRSIREVRGSGAFTGEEAIGKEQRRLADQALLQADPAKATPDQCVLWVQVCDFSSDPSQALPFAKRAHSARVWELMALDTHLLLDALKEKRNDEAVRIARNVNFSLGPAMLGQFHLGVKRRLATLAEANFEGVWGVYEAFLSRVEVREGALGADRRWGPLVVADLESSQYELLFATGKKEEALAGLEALHTRMEGYPDSADAYGKTAAQYVEDAIRRLQGTDLIGRMVGADAPAVVYDRVIGEFGGVESLEGKVVVLDFMAHWCGPCKAALPDLLALHRQFGKDGVEVLSLTGYYGFIGSEQGLSEGAEFEAMKGFVKDEGLEWPVLFDKSLENNRNFGVNGIPHFVVIDRAGKVRKVLVGYTPDSFADLARLVEGLVKEE